MTKKTSVQKLDDDIVTLDKNIQNSNSFWKNFLRGLATGTGTAIGASIVAAIIIAILIKFVRTAEHVPVLNQILHSFDATDTLENKN